MIYRGVDLAWAAGFLDGEGCFTITRSHAKRQVSPRINAAQIVEAPLLKLQGLFGGSLVKLGPPKGNERQAWKWEVYGASAVVRILPELLPFLVVKKDQAELMLEFAQRIDPKNGGRGRRLSDDELVIREEYAHELAGMKR